MFRPKWSLRRLALGVNRVRHEATRRRASHTPGTGRDAVLHVHYTCTNWGVDCVLIDSYVRAYIHVYLIWAAPCFRIATLG